MSTQYRIESDKNWVCRQTQDRYIYTKADRVNFPGQNLTSDFIKKNNIAIDKAVKALKAECKKQKVTLYCDSMDEQNRMVYRIKEIPSFVARIHAPELEF